MRRDDDTPEPSWHGRWDIQPGESRRVAGEDGLRELRALAGQMGALCRRLQEEAAERSDEPLAAFTGELQALVQRIDTGACRLQASTERADAQRDRVDEASMESFPASDPASGYQGT